MNAEFHQPQFHYHLTTLPRSSTLFLLTSALLVSSFALHSELDSSKLALSFSVYAIYFSICLIGDDLIPRFGYSWDTSPASLFEIWHAEILKMFMIILSNLEDLWVLDLIIL